MKSKENILPKCPNCGSEINWENIGRKTNLPEILETGSEVIEVIYYCPKCKTILGVGLIKES